MDEEIISIPNEAEFIEIFTPNFDLVKYKGRVRRMAKHHYVKPLIKC